MGPEKTLFPARVRLPPPTFIPTLPAMGALIVALTPAAKFRLAPLTSVSVFDPFAAMVYAPAATGLNWIPDAWTVPAGESIVMMPAFPPLPMFAKSPSIQGKLLAPSVQLAAVVFHVPPPTVATVGELPLASHVSCCPSATWLVKPAANASMAA